MYGTAYTEAEVSKSTVDGSLYAGGGVQNCAVEGSPNVSGSASGASLYGNVNVGGLRGDGEDEDEAEPMGVLANGTAGDNANIGGTYSGTAIGNANAGDGSTSLGDNQVLGEDGDASEKCDVVFPAQAEE